MPRSPGPPCRRGRGSAPGVSRVGPPRTLGGAHHPLRYLVFEVRLGTVLPLLKHVCQLVQATMMEVENLVLALPAGHDQLAAGAGLVAGPRSQGERKGRRA